VPLAAWLLVGVAGSANAAAPPTYTLDATKSTLEFTFVQAGAKNKGRFPKFTLDFAFGDDNLAASKLDVTINVAALDTADQDATTLRDTDLFAVRNTRRRALAPRRSRRAAPATKRRARCCCAG